MPAPSKPQLPAEDLAAQAVELRLRKVAQRFEPVLRQRVTKLLLASAEAILHLADLDLVRYEADGEVSAHSLVLWEELAPVMSGSVQSVNQVIADTLEAFPSPKASESADDLDAAFGPDPGFGLETQDSAPGSVEVEIAKLVAALTSGLRRDVARLGERLRNPTVTADTWNLISDLLEFRGRMRAGLGELIFQVVCFVEEVQRQEVVPGYAAELEQSLTVRQATNNLAFLFRGHTRRIAGSTEPKIGGALQDALKDLHAFSRTRALPALRTSDKRIFLETSAQLYAFAKEGGGRAREIRQGVENLARFLDSMSVVSRREVLRLHDREQLAAAGRKLEAMQAKAARPDEARRELVEAVRAAQALYGRDAQLDAYLRGQRHFPVEWLSDGELQPEADRFGAILANIPAP